MRLRNKYRAQKTVVDGITFDSKGEAALYQELLLRKQSGEFTAIRCHVPFKLFGHDGSVVCKHVVDFLCETRGDPVVIEHKGVSTAVFKLKKKLFELSYPHIKYIVHKQRSWQKRRRKAA